MTEVEKIETIDASVAGADVQTGAYVYDEDGLLVFYMGKNRASVAAGQEDPQEWPSVDIQVEVRTIPGPSYLVKWPD